MQIWKSDVAVFTLNRNVGKLAGYMGVGWDPNGYTGGISAAGYPTQYIQTVVRPREWRRQVIGALTVAPCGTTLNLRLQAS
jgi:hypothetical protein